MAWLGPFAQSDDERSGLSRLTAWHLQSWDVGAKLSDDLANCRKLVHLGRRSENEGQALLSRRFATNCLVRLDVLPARVLYILKMLGFITSEGDTTLTKPLFRTSYTYGISRSDIDGVPTPLLDELDRLINNFELTYDLYTTKFVDDDGMLCFQWLLL